MRVRTALLVSIAAAVCVGSATPAAISPSAFRDADAKAAMQRLKDTSEEFKYALDHGLDKSVLEGKKRMIFFQ